MFLGEFCEGSFSCFFDDASCFVAPTRGDVDVIEFLGRPEMVVVHRFVVVLPAVVLIRVFAERALVAEFIAADQPVCAEEV